MTTQQITEATEPAPLQITPVGGTCAACRFSELHRGTGGKVTQRFCRRMPPTATSFPMPVGPQTIQFHTHTAWPLVEPGGWCGEFRSRLAT